MLSGIDWKTVIITVLLMLFAIPLVSKIISKAV